MAVKKCETLENATMANKRNPLNPYGRRGLLINERKYIKNKRISLENGTTTVVPKYKQ